MLLRPCFSSPSPEVTRVMIRSMALFLDIQRKIPYTVSPAAPHGTSRRRRLCRRRHRIRGLHQKVPFSFLVLKTQRSNTVDIQASANPLASEPCRFLDGLIESVPVVPC